jgi:DNA-binding PadR family transcriptional regulator
MQPLKTEVLWLLLSVNEGERHGYALMQDVEARSGRALRIQTGALYRTLHRMLREGLVTEVDAPAGEVDERRRYYRITARGRAAAATELTRMRSLVETGIRGGLLGGHA